MAGGHRGARWGAVVLLASLVVAPAVLAGAKDGSAVPASLVGRWSRNVTQKDWVKYKVGNEGFPVGVWSIRILKDGSAEDFEPQARIYDQQFEVAIHGAQLTVSHDPACGSTLKGLYRWKVSGRQLTLTLVKDACEPRAALFNGVWRK